MTTQKEQEVLDETPLTGEHSTIEGQNALRVKVGKYAKWLVIEAGGIKLCVIRHSDGPVDPLSDLNACAELEKALPINKRINYIYELMLCLGYKSHWWSNGINVEHMRQVATATAEQRCRAFVAVMEGKKISGIKEAVELTTNTTE